MPCFFTSDVYRAIAFDPQNYTKPSGRTAQDAFAELLSGLPYGMLDNLCTYIQKKNPHLTGQACYALTQSEAAGQYLSDAYRCLADGLPLGTANNDGRNASDWLGHCLLNGRVCATLAAACGLDAEYAMKLGLLHDCGRKITHTFAHTYLGFEMLWNRAWQGDAFACLTHSFLNGDRCATMERAEPGFYVNEQGEGCWKQGVPVDDFTVFLKKFTTTEYEIILSFGDLTATGTAILPPAERVADIATRRVFDPVNYFYFLAEFCNQMGRMLQRLNFKMPPYTPIKADNKTTEEAIRARFAQMSALYAQAYKTLPVPDIAK